MKVKFEYSFQATVEKEGNWYVASCSSLDVHSQGKTESKAKSNLNEALRLFIESCWERGTLDEVLRSEGFEPVHDETPSQGDKKILTISVPLVLASRQNAPAHAH